MSRRARLSLAFGALVVAGGLFFAAANKVAPLSWGLWGDVNQDEGLALKGFDPVAYHTEKRAWPGDAAISARWAGVEWQFVSAVNKQLFEADAEAYAPRYGGFCASAIAEGLTADIDPEIWHRAEGRLYVFNNQGAKDSWVDALGAGVIRRGDDNWEFR